jgi:hypothetical protein
VPAAGRNHRLSRGGTRVLRLASIVLFLTVSAAVQATGRASTLTAIVLSVPQEYHTGGAYTAIQAAPDGRVYLGTTFYDGFARFLSLSPGGREFQLIADMASATGERIPGPYAQAKIHSKPAVAPDGKVYFGTKSGKPANDERWQANYPGGHLLVYDPQVSRVTDLGIPRPRQSIIAVGVDQQRNIVYALTDPEGHLIAYTPRTHTFADKGRFAPNSPPTRYLVVLPNGDAFHPAGADAFIRYQAASDTIQRLPLRFSGQGRYEVSDLGHGPYAMAAGVDGARFYGVGETSGDVYTFTPGDHAIAVEMHPAASLQESGQKTIYYTMTAAPDGNIYYTAVALGSAPEGTLYLLRLVTKTGMPEVSGQVAPIPPPPGWQHPYRLMTEGSTSGPDGTLYVMLAYPLRVLVFPKLAARP